MANVSLIRQQAPLHETADEFCAVARDIGARATEREVKAMSESGKLAQYRIVHFATHGARAGELDKSSEPVSASEIAALKLDADWLILLKLITSAMREIARDRTVGRAEALRRSMLALIDKGDPHEAHPSYWAPFVVVGEGAL